MLYGELDPYSNLQPLPYDDSGWNSHSPVFKEIIDKIKPNLIIEVGTWLGKSARYMATLASKYNPDFEIVCIDTFLGSHENWEGQHIKGYINGRPNLYEQFISNVVHSKLEKYITPFPIDSINGYIVLQKKNIEADVIYIDAGHDYVSVKQDINRWRTLVKPSGCLIGDDYAFSSDIRKAVEEEFGNGNFQVSGEKFIWWKK